MATTGAKSTTLTLPFGHGVRLSARVRMAMGVMAIAGATFASLASSPAAGRGLVIVLALGVALPVTFGVLRLERDRTDRFAWMLVGAGALWSLTLLAESGDSSLYSVGRVAVWLVEPVLVVLILTFPTGRLRTAVDRRLAMWTAIVAAALFVPTALLSPDPEPSPWASCGTDCPSNAFLVDPNAAGFVNGYVRPMRELLIVLLFAAVVWVLVRRARSSGQLTRRILVPVVVVALVRAVGMGTYLAGRATGPSSTLTDVVSWLYMLTLPALTIAFGAGLLAHRLFVADAFERLTRSLAPRATASQLRAALARALRDPSLQVVYRAPGTPSGWVDQTGWPTSPPEPAPGMAVTGVVVDGRKVAAIVHDEELLDSGALVEAASAYAATAFENENLVEQLRASLDELSRSRARIVAATDEERRRIERDLHDGAQQRLVALRIWLGLIADQLEAAAPDNAADLHLLEDEVGTTIDEMRHFARGVYPALLTDCGLTEALRSAARSAPIPTTVRARDVRRYAPEIETAIYFACVEALQNASKHAQGATAVRIDLSGNGRVRFEVRDDGVGFNPATTARGAGLTNLRDRLDAVGGVLEITSSPGAGTRVAGSIPIPAAATRTVSLR